MIKKTFKTPWNIEIEAYYRENTIDENVLISCLVEDEYGMGKLPENGVAIDLGVYIGGATLALHSRGYKVIGVEMTPKNYHLAAINCFVNDFEPLIYDKAIASSDKEIVIAHYEQSPESTFNASLLSRKVNGDQEFLVQTISLPTVFKEQNIDHCDFLKVDIEGAEWDVFQHLPVEYLDKIDRIAIELHGINGKTTSIREFLPLLKGKFKDVSSEYFPKWCGDGEYVHGFFIRK